VRIRLPEALKRRLRPLPQWASVGVQQPQQMVQVRLRIANITADVTWLCTVAALCPFTLALALDEHLAGLAGTHDRAVLELFDRDAMQIVGALDLRLAPQQIGTRDGFALFEVLGDRQRCLSWPLRPWTRWLQTRAMRAGAKPGNFYMSPAAIHQTMVFYMCPRPVVAVSVENADHRNMFPMDLIGPLGADKFMLALRSTSPSIDAMVASGRVALADFRAQDVQLAYMLGAHHKRSMADWTELPFATRHSHLFGLPVPAQALRVRELEIVGSDVVGSHRLFSGRILSEELRDAGAQLCHVPGIYQHFRQRLGRPLSPARP
jgi:flavin reductase (DIM6/NTAB) family NADH-FMN oxidoreductase RutF